MSLKYACICLITFLYSFSSSGQHEKLKFVSFNMAGISSGEIGTYLNFQTVNGVQYQNWFTGIGGGYDLYYYKSIPLFVDVRRYLIKNNNFLVYGEAGYNIPVKNIPKDFTFYSTYHFKGGFYFEGGVGYKIKIINKVCFLLTTGYTHKELSDRLTQMYCPFIGPCLFNSNTYHYNFGRLAIKAGIVF